MIDLFGTYTHNIDAKGRVALPSAFRKKLPTDLVVMPDLRGECLYVFDEEGFSEWVALLFEKQGGYNPLSESQNKLRSTINGRARSVSQDSAGRINLPSDMREQVGLDKEAMLVGNSGYFEIWDAKRREEAIQEIDLSTFLVD